MDRELPVSVWPEWKIIEKIGEGSFGKVYKAQRLERDKAFYSAIKIITIPSNQGELKSVRSEMDSDQSVREYFQNLVEECIQEVSTMEYFRGNSHVVAVEDYKVVEYLDTVGWDIYIRMEYLTSFLEYCAGKQMDEKEVIQLGIDLCKALEYCQKLNIIHRDIKPENIFISRFGEFKLGDFGIARELERTMSTLSKKGTYSYMAPEMYRGEKYDSRVDIYSLGIMLYKLRNRNRLPFVNLEKQLITYRDKENALTRRMSGEQLPAPADAGAGFASVILKACAYNCDDRYSSAVEFREALEELKYGRASAAYQQPQKQAQSTIRQQSPYQSRAQESVRRSAAIPQNESRQSSYEARQAQMARAERQPKPEQVNRVERQPKPEQMARAERQSKPEQVSRVERQSKPESQNRTEYQSKPEQIARAEHQPKPEQPMRKQQDSADTFQSAPVKRSKKKKKSDTTPLMAAVIVMTIAVIAVTVIFFRLLFNDNSSASEASESGGIGQLISEAADESEMEGLAEDMQVIRERATQIANELDTPYQWIGTESDGKISYLNKAGQIMKVLIYPSLSKEGVYEEYYYWDDELFFAYIWTEEEEGHVQANYYYYKDGNLIRWIDSGNVCHDYETDNEEYNTLGERYWNRSLEYIKDFLQENGDGENGVSD